MRPSLPPTQAFRPDADQEPNRAPLADTAAAGQTTPAADDPNRTTAYAPGAAPHSFPAIPGFAIEAELGRGGMGVVYRAKQLGLDRTVALKMILRADFASPEQKLRFQIEAENAARVQHPNIVQVFEIGEHQGQPYFALEFVEGGSLADWMAKSRATPNEAAALVETLAHAVHAAHLQGIVHRDLKPANVLLGEPSASAGGLNPKIADFGLAKRLDSGAELTGSGAVMGTPSYMSPEQAKGDTKHVGPAADQYALGAIFYQLLTQRLPFEAATVPGLLRMIAETEPTPPRKRNPAVPSDLEVICLKALAKEPGRRYPSAEAFAEDLRNWREHRPILARPATRTERVVKWCRRYPAVAALIVVSVLAALVASGLAAWAVGERTRKDMALEEKTNALEAEKKSRVSEQKAHARALTALRDLTDDIVEYQMARGTQLTDENRAFLRRIIKHFETFAAIADSDADSRAIRAEGNRRVGMMRYRLGEWKEAEAALDEAVASYRRLADEFPSRPEFRFELAGARHSLGILLQVANRLGPAESAFGEAVDIQRRLVAESPDRLEFRAQLAASLNSQGGLFCGTGRPKEGEARWREALGIYERLIAEFPNRTDLRQHQARMHHNLGVLMIELSRLKEAETSYGEALTIRKRLAKAFPSRTDYRQEVAISHNAMGTLLSAHLGRLEDAERAFQEGLAVLKQLVEDYPGRMDFRRQLAEGHNNFGGLLSDMGQLKEAENAYAEALSIRRRLTIDFPTYPDLRNELAGTLLNFSTLCRRRGEFAAAAAYLDEAGPLHATILKANPKHPVYRACYRRHLFALVRAKAGLLDQSGATRAAETIRDLGWDPPVDAYQAACALAACIPIAAKSDGLDAAQREASVQHYENQAIAMLRQAVGQGFRDLEQFKKDPHLAPLRGREDFKKLLAELERKQEKK